MTTLLDTALRGALIGLPLGYVMQCTRLCFNTAYRAALLRRDFTLVRMIGLAIVIQMVGLYALAQLRVGGVRVNVVPFYWMANIVGGMVFGLAMTFAEGCSSTVWYRVGNGNVGALVTLVGFAGGEALTSFGPLGPLRDRLQSSVITPASGSIPTLPSFLGVSPWLFVVPLALMAGAWLWRAPHSSYLHGWGWRRGGFALGAIATVAWLVAWPTGWHYGVGIVGATGPWLLAPFRGPGVLNWGSFMVAAMPLGAMIAALRRNEFRWQVPNLSGVVRMSLAGLLMGVSASVAGGCNIGHGFSGLPTLALSSLATTLFTFFGAALGVHWRFGRSGPKPVELRLRS